MLLCHRSDFSGTFLRFPDGDNYGASRMGSRPLHLRRRHICDWSKRPQTLTTRKATSSFAGGCGCLQRLLRGSASWCVAASTSSSHSTSHFSRSWLHGKHRRREKAPAAQPIRQAVTTRTRTSPKRTTTKCKPAAGPGRLQKGQGAQLI